MLELVAIWAIVIPTVVWFVRDEQRLRREAKLRVAARYYAQAPQYRHVNAGDPAPQPVPLLRIERLTQAQQTFVDQFTQPVSPAAG